MISAEAVLSLSYDASFHLTPNRMSLVTLYSDYMHVLSPPPPPLPSSRLTVSQHARRVIDTITTIREIAARPVSEESVTESMPTSAVLWKAAKMTWSAPNSDANDLYPPCPLSYSLSVLVSVPLPSNSFFFA